LKEILTCDLARTYLSSLPGWDEKSPNVAFHAQLRDFLEWKREERALGKDLIDILYDQLTYRLDSMREADRLREQMGLIFADISTFNTDVWILNCNQAGKEQTRSFYYRVLDLTGNRVFHGPMGRAGYPYRKPKEYLAITLVESGTCRRIAIREANRAVATTTNARIAAAAALLHAPVGSNCGNLWRRRWKVSANAEAASARNN
jgi:hypothetical protein